MEQGLIFLEDQQPRTRDDAKALFRFIHDMRIGDRELEGILDKYAKKHPNNKSLK